MEQDKQLTELTNLASLPSSGALIYVRDENEAIDVDKDKYFDISTLNNDLANKLEASDIADFETTTELNARDTDNRDRANHTGTQAISTVSGLQDDLDSKASTTHTHVKADITDLASSELIPSGGTDGQVLSKVSGSVAWADASGGGAFAIFQGF